MDPSLTKLEEFIEDEWDERDHPKHLDQASLVCDIGMLLAKVYGWKHVETRQFNAIVAAANLIMDEFSKPGVRAEPDMGIEKWLASDDVGQSSLFMARMLCEAVGGIQPRWPYREWFSTGEKPYPHDPADLDRCRKLLLAVPAMAAHVAEMASYGPVWKAYIENWDELIKMLESELPTGSAPRTYDWMQKLQEAACSKS